MADTAASSATVRLPSGPDPAAAAWRTLESSPLLPREWWFVGVGGSASGWLANLAPSSGVCLPHSPTADAETGGDAHDTFTVVQFNTLAEALCCAASDWGGFTQARACLLGGAAPPCRGAGVTATFWVGAEQAPPEALAWERRRVALLHAILAPQPDVVCLQVGRTVAAPAGLADSGSCGT